MLPSTRGCPQETHATLAKWHFMSPNDPTEKYRTIYTKVYAGIISMQQHYFLPFLKNSLPIELTLALSSLCNRDCSQTQGPASASPLQGYRCTIMPGILCGFFGNVKDFFPPHRDYFIVFYKPEFSYICLQSIKSETSQTIPLLFKEST